MSFNHLAARLYNTPLMISPQKAAVIESVLRSRIEMNAASIAELRSTLAESLPEESAVAYRQTDPQRPRAYRITEGGTAVIPVTGTLMHRGGWMDAMSGLTSYRSLEMRLQQAINDAEVQGILLELDSPGGEVAGLFDFADRLAAAREKKPVWGIANEEAFSAAYAIGASVEKLYTPRTGMTGSIGVLMLFRDQSKHDEKAGYAYEYIVAGERKAEFNPHAPLSSSARARLEAMVQDSYGLFVDHVVRQRGISADVVRGTEAGIFTAPDAEQLGLIDGIATFDETLDNLERSYQGAGFHSTFSPRAAAPTHQANGGSTMPHENNPAAPGNPAATHTEADAARIRAEAHAAGREEGITAERERASAILTHEEATGRTALAHQAVANGLSVEQATAMMAAAPREAAAAVPDLALAADAAVGVDGAEDELDDRKAGQRAAAAFYGKAN
jgi:signal peptide peptidase SppA